MTKFDTLKIKFDSWIKKFVDLLCTQLQWKDFTAMTEYITEINNLLNCANEETLDFILQFLQKSVTPLLEKFPQSAWRLQVAQRLVGSIPQR